MTEYNKVETQDGYTKVRTHDFVAIENELAALRAERDELREALQEIATAVEHLDDERMVETWGSVAMSMRVLARAVLAKYEGKE